MLQIFLIILIKNPQQWMSQIFLINFNIYCSSSTNALIHSALSLPHWWDYKTVSANGMPLT